jgi:RNA polymerase sigma-70 factor (ECF subfamily)
MCTVSDRMDALTRDLVAARDGDRLAFAAVVRGAQAEVWRLCAHLVGRGEADDLTQDTFVRVVRALPAFRGDASARTWLLSIARRACADAVRRNVCNRRRDAAAGHHLATIVPDASSSAAADALIAELDPDQRLAFVLTQLHGLAYAEAAAVCDVPIGTIRSRVARARMTLVETLRAADAV